MKNRIKPAIGGFFLLCAVFVCQAEEVRKKAYKEFGVGVVGQYLADYRGSSRYQAYALPIPYIAYKSDRLKVDRRGVRGMIFTSDNVELNLSVDASLNGKSEDNSLREGMPELDSAFELGPSLNINLSGKDFSEGWVLKLPVHSVFTLSTEGIENIGWLVNPRLNWRKENIGHHWRASLNLGVLYGSEKFHDYYYSVQPEYARSFRPEYKAKAGYSGEFIRLTLFRSWGSYKAGVSLRYDHLSNASFNGSPLLETDHYGSISFAIIKKLWSN